jgi:hypothetical protein
MKRRKKEKEKNFSNKKGQSSLLDQ